MLFKNRIKIIELQNRIKELEEKICPCEQHEYIEVDREFISLECGNIDVKKRFKCRRCGKEKIKIE